MTATLERSGVVSHDMYTRPTEVQIEAYQDLERARKEYTQLLENNPRFEEALSEGLVDESKNGTGVFAALIGLNVQLSSKFEDMEQSEKEEHPDYPLHQMVKLRLEIAILELDIDSSCAVTGIRLEEIAQWAA